MKYRILLSFLLIYGFAQAQIPQGYYQEAEGLNGYELKTKLSQITSNGHNAQTYASLWNFFNTVDVDQYYENDGTILDIYSENPNGADPYNYTPVSDQCGTYSNEGDCYNREHLMPQSWFGQGMPMRTDIHHIFPTDGYVNAIHANLPFGEVNNPNHTSLNGSKRGSNTYDHPQAYTGEVFEPIDEFKGEIARAYLYMAMRYGDLVPNWVNANGNQNTFDGSSDQVFNDWSISLFLKWHNEDPVSQWEIDRNNAAYDYQGNRNPFIDHPEYANMIWDADNTTEPSDYLFEEDFNDCSLVADSFVVYSEMSPADWECQPNGGQGDSGSMQMNANYNGTNEPSRDWLITAEALDFEDYIEEKLSFYASSLFGNTPLTLLYSHSYDGEGNPADFEWDEVPGVSIPVHSGNSENVHIFSDVDIEEIASAPFYLAFLYDNSNGEGATLWTIDNVSISGVDEMGWDTPESLSVSIYPNPTDRGEVVLNVGTEFGFSYRIFDLTGRSLQQGQESGNEKTLDVRDLSSGVYLIKINTDQATTTKRLIVR